MVYFTSFYCFVETCLGDQSGDIECVHKAILKPSFSAVQALEKTWFRNYRFEWVVIFQAYYLYRAIKVYLFWLSSIESGPYNRIYILFSGRTVTPHMMRFVAAKKNFGDCFGRYIIPTVPMDSDAEKVTGMVQCMLLWRERTSISQYFNCTDILFYMVIAIQWCAYST